MRYLLIVLITLPVFITAQEKQGKISGKVINKETGEPIAYCNISMENKRVRTFTDHSGKYRLLLPFGAHKITFSIIGYSTLTKEISVSQQKAEYTLDVQLASSSILEDEIVVKGKQDAINTTVQKISTKDLSKIPNMYSDVIRSVQILSGVSSNNELSSGYNVHGGTFEENLIYLNGYEIYRPFLLRQGVEENQSIINAEMVTDMKFYNGGFPAKYGDKMSSALEVKYTAEKSDHISGLLRADLLNMGLSLKGSAGNFNWKTGFRLAYPALFVKRLQTQGDYKPSFSDIQFLGNYSLSSGEQIEAFFLYSVNKYDLSPKEWVGNFQMSMLDIRQININQSGDKYYTYKTNLAAVKYLKSIDNASSLTVAVSRYFSKEDEKSDVIGDIFYSPDAARPEDGREFLFTRTENINDNASLSSLNFQTEFKTTYSSHNLTAGFEFKNISLSSSKNEFYVEDGANAVQTVPQVQLSNSDYTLNTLALFAEDSFPISSRFNANAGIRFLKSYFTGENLLSPRFSISYDLNKSNVLNFRTGVYYQLPFFNELTGLVDNTGKLKAQRAIHYSIDWKNQLKEKVIMTWEIFYKKLDYLVPFYYEDLKMICIKGNVNEGYSFGFDVMFQGEISDGLESWLGYSYLNSKEREINSGEPYRRRLLDQTHTFQIFLQDHFKKHRNWESHLRLLGGSGFLYNIRKLVKNQSTNLYETVVDLDNPQVYTLYLRADMGLSAAFGIKEKSKLTITFDVMNIFDQNNYAGFDWIRVFNDSQGLIKIPKILSKRFFNLKAEYSF
jgi:hypothetical protein